MKKLIIALFIALFGFGMAKDAMAVKLVFQTRAHGRDCDKDRGLCVMVEVELQEILDLIKFIKPAAWYVDAKCDGSFLELNTIKLGTPWGGSDFVVDSDITLSPEISQALGYRVVTIKAGTYRLDFSSNSQGTIKLPVRTS